ncbi:MAG: hypothetical protein ACKV2U_32855 [Bryobacteraceae bacterium]
MSKPHAAVLRNEDRPANHAVLDELIAIYRPQNRIAASVVTGIANARSQVERLNHCLAMQWNSVNTPAPKLAEIESIARVSQALNRQIDQLELRIARFERRLKFLHASHNVHATAERTTPSPVGLRLPNREIAPRKAA